MHFIDYAVGVVAADVVWFDGYIQMFQDSGCWPPILRRTGTTYHRTTLLNVRHSICPKQQARTQGRFGARKRVPPLTITNVACTGRDTQAGGRAGDTHALAQANHAAHGADQKSCLTSS